MPGPPAPWSFWKPGAGMGSFATCVPGTRSQGIKGKQSCEGRRRQAQEGTNAGLCPWRSRTRWFCDLVWRGWWGERKPCLIWPVVTSDFARKQKTSQVAVGVGEDRGTCPACPSPILSGAQPTRLTWPTDEEEEAHSQRQQVPARVARVPGALPAHAPASRPALLTP